MPVKSSTAFLAIVALLAMHHLCVAEEANQEAKQIPQATSPDVTTASAEGNKEYRETHDKHRKGDDYEPRGDYYEPRGDYYEPRGDYYEPHDEQHVSHDNYPQDVPHWYKYSSKQYNHYLYQGPPGPAGPPGTSDLCVPDTEQFVNIPENVKQSTLGIIAACNDPSNPDPTATFQIGGACIKSCPQDAKYSPMNLFATFDIVSQGWIVGDGSLGPFGEAYTVCIGSYTSNSTGGTPLTALFNYETDILNAGEPECQVTAAALCCRPVGGVHARSKQRVTPIIPIPEHVIRKPS